MMFPFVEFLYRRGALDGWISFVFLWSYDRRLDISARTEASRTATGNYIILVVYLVDMAVDRTWTEKEILDTVSKVQPFLWGIQKWRTRPLPFRSYWCKNPSFPSSISLKVSRTMVIVLGSETTSREPEWQLKPRVWCAIFSPTIFSLPAQSKARVATLSVSRRTAVLRPSRFSRI